MDNLLIVEFIGLGIIICFIGAYTRFNMLSRNKTFLELIKEFIKKEDKVNPPSLDVN